MNPKNEFKIGQRVGVVNETLEGKIIQLRLDKITIECDDGFNYQYGPKELILKKDWKNMIKGRFEKELEDENSFSPLNTLAKKKNHVEEVDLHIHELIDTEYGMSNFDKLSLQLSVARAKLEEAILKKQKRIVFIHGRGDGVLKNEVRELFKKYPVEFYDASYSKYGTGATEVLIFQNKKPQIL
jgi:hypothetical protein